MQYKKWIMSEGGPLIMINKDLLLSWGGVLSRKSDRHSFNNDYEWICETERYLEAYVVAGSSALVVGDAPLDTCFWRHCGGPTFMVRTWFCEEDFDIDTALAGMQPEVFNDPKESMTFKVENPNFLLFDSAEPGDDPDKKNVEATFDVGLYRILTQTYEPDALTSLVLHRFDRLD